jgi:UDP-N-acetylglucosamine acyltransferase
MPNIHPTAIVNKGAEIAENVMIGPFCYIEEDVKIGGGTKIMNNATLLAGTRLGEENLVFPGAVLGAVPQDLKFGGEYSELNIGSGNKIREFVTMNRGTFASGKTDIGNNNLFMAYSHVAHDCVIENNCILANSVALGGHVTLEDYVIIGGLSGVHQFVRIGAHAMIGASSMVVKDVVPYALFSGDPLAFKGLNMVGLTRRNFSKEQTDSLKESFRIIFNSGLNVTHAMEKIKSSLLGCKEVSYLLSFMEKSSRGIAK